MAFNEDFRPVKAQQRTASFVGRALACRPASAGLRCMGRRTKVRHKLKLAPHGATEVRHKLELAPRGAVCPSAGVLGFSTVGRALACRPASAGHGSTGRRTKVRRKVNLAPHGAVYPR